MQIKDWGFLSMGESIGKKAKELAESCYAFAEIPIQPETLPKIETEEKALLGKVMTLLEKQREKGRGKLGDASTLDEIKGEETFTDGWINYIFSRPDEDIYFIGDLHGAYNCLKQILEMTGFFHQMALPSEERCLRLIFLGDFIDRGTEGFRVLRLVFHLKTLFPDRFFLIRGNHEEFEQDENTGEILPAVYPSDHLEYLQSLFPLEIIQRYKKVFDLLPCILLLNRGVIGVHGGLPKERYFDSINKIKDLNHPDILKQMRWSDPAEEIPPLFSLFHEASGRFYYNEDQFNRFMNKIGARYLVRSHEPKENGFEFLFNGRLLTIFSSGGEGNEELSTYRVIQPMIAYCAGDGTLTPKRVSFQQSSDWKKKRKT